MSVCGICSKVFISERGLNRHIRKNRCKLLRVKSNNKQIEIPRPEATTMEPAPYIGREYNFNPIPTGNRHLRSGIPLPRLSKWSKAAI